MVENFSINEILEAVNTLLDSKIKKKSYNKKEDKLLPEDTEEIISQAEKYIKKK